MTRTAFCALALSAALASPCHAWAGTPSDQHYWLVVTLRDGSKKAWPYDERPTITFSDERFVVTTADGSQALPASSVDGFRLTTDYDEPRIQGDINGDGAVDVADIATIITVMAGGTNAAAVGDGAATAADVNADGTVDVADIATVITIMAQGNGQEEGKETFTVNGVTFKMVTVEGGTFDMGNDDSESYGDERYIHSVQLSTFSIAETEVTQELWQAVMGYNYSDAKGPRLPVEKVSWNECATFCKKLSQLTGRTFRLPTEAEWEFAARGGTKSQAYKYAGSNTMDDVAWHFGNSKRKSHEVGTKQPNELGIYDMTGNVSEWCNDWYSPQYYNASAMVNPQGPSSGKSHVFRGGSFIDSSQGSRTTFRNDAAPDMTSWTIGLRLAM